MEPLLQSLIVLVATLVLHLVEEVTTGFRVRFPLGEMPRSLFVLINVAIYAYALVMIVLAARGNPLAVSMAWPFALMMLVNGLGHLIIMGIRREYFPGGITAVALIVASLYVLMKGLAQFI